ncbi:hypothetical protein BCV70DRAFT_5156 [Testicularia cyperi]|uniref:Secreted protein n=1 Tax=Testicularia cyperi TaxID=1882483 RepID=A0A317XXT2_9BASI|nr:hypothetical protein BCV70DRAFT_5156 [Testicularia cyperi]
MQDSTSSEHRHGRKACSFFLFFLPSFSCFSLLFATDSSSCSSFPNRTVIVICGYQHEGCKGANRQELKAFASHSHTLLSPWSTATRHPLCAGPTVRQPHAAPRDRRFFRLPSCPCTLSAPPWRSQPPNVRIVWLDVKPALAPVL